MIQVMEEKVKGKDTIIPMRDMKPLQVGIIESDGCGGCEGHYVQRTAATTHFEVMDLTGAGVDSCWAGAPTCRVRLLHPDESITIKLFNT